jgi:hypothetical protein
VRNDYLSQPLSKSGPQEVLRSLLKRYPIYFFVISRLQRGTLEVTREMLDIDTVKHNVGGCTFDIPSRCVTDLVRDLRSGR